MLSNISLSFNDQGYMSEFSLFWKEKKIRTHKYEYNENNFPQNMNQYTLFSALWGIDKDDWSKSYYEYHEIKDTLQETFQYYGSTITKFSTIKEPDTIFSNRKIIYRFEKRGKSKTLETIEKNLNNIIYIDSAYIWSNKHDDIFKIEYFQDSAQFKNNKKGEATMYLENNIVYKVLPGISNKVFDNFYRLIEDENYKYTYDRNGLYKTIYDKKNDILSTVSYEFDSRDNWTKMEITPTRYKMDQLYDKLDNLLDENRSYRKRFEEYNRMSYPPIDKMEHILNMLKDNNQNIEDVNFLINLSKDQFSKIIVLRNILYYNDN